MSEATPPTLADLIDAIDDYRQLKTSEPETMPSGRVLTGPHKRVVNKARARLNALAAAVLTSAVPPQPM